MTMTTASLLARAHDGVVDEPDPAARPRRRSFTAEYKARILDEYDALPAGSEGRGGLLRREGLYTSHIAEWRKARDAGARDGLAPKAKPRRSTGAGRGGAAASPQRAARGGAGPHQAGVGDHGKSARALGTALRERGLRPEVEAVIDEHFDDLEAVTSTKQACALLGASRATRYRRRRPPVTRSAVASAGTAECADRGRASAHPGGAALGGVLRSGARPGVGPAARRRHLPVLDLHDVPAAGRSPARTGNGAANAPTRPASAPS